MIISINEKLGISIEILIKEYKLNKGKSRKIAPSVA
jgi:hypothetical protein